MNDIYKALQEKLTVDHLKRLTIDIIDAFNKKNTIRHREYAKHLGIDPDIKKEKLFSQLIHTCHPDRHAFIMKNAAALYESGDFNSLKQLHDRYILTIKKAPVVDTDIIFQPEYSFSSEDFGYHETAPFEKDEFRESTVHNADEEYGFYEALQKNCFGGLDNTISESDLNNLDGELDLSDYELTDLTGIDKCLHLTELNLSHNHIEKIGRLSSLKELEILYLSENNIEDIASLGECTKLRELDLSFNEIKDISILAALDKLEYVNLLGNPIDDYSVVTTLIQRKVIVICETDEISSTFQ